MVGIRHGVVNFFFLGNLLIPSSLFFFRFSSSYSLGLGAVSITGLALMFMIKKNVSIPSLFLLGLLTFLLFVTSHTLIVSSAPSLWIDRFSYSVLLSLIFALGAAGIAMLAVRMDASYFHIVVMRCAWLLLLIGFLGALFGKGIGHIMEWRSPLPPFSEPSHFIIAAAPFSLYLFASRERRLSFLHIFLLFVVLLFTRNVTCLTLLALIALIRAPFLTGAAFSLVVVFSNWLLLLPEYYLTRLAFWEGENLTALVYLQGWQIIIDGVVGGNTLGYGFQQLGRVSFGLDASQLIQSLLGRGSNILDGGFVAAKLFGEFGLFAFPIVFFLLLTMIKSYFAIRAHLNKKSVLPPIVLFARCVLLGYAIELFFRGIGYFSIGGSLVLFALAIVSLHRITASLEPRFHACPE